MKKEGMVFLADEILAGAFEAAGQNFARSMVGEVSIGIIFDFELG
jgi:hypothetical protein